MFIINWWMALITIAIVGVIFGYVVYKKPDVNWGSSSAALLYITALKSAYKLQQTEDHVKNFRPQLLVLTGLPSSRPDLTLLACQINRNVGSVISGQVLVVSFGGWSGRVH
jgi:solute carrier family 12 sodium/potassium/chloride transporter 2